MTKFGIETYIRSIRAKKNCMKRKNKKKIVQVDNMNKFKNFVKCDRK